MVEYITSQIRDKTSSTRPAFMHIFIQPYLWNPRMLSEVLQKLGMVDYIPVRADELSYLYLLSTKR